jgi:NAD(P)-dependent dehydrogenase (short-subunit alcohol dehydrogenase family)
LTLEALSRRALRISTVFSIAYLKPGIGTRIAFHGAHSNRQPREAEMGAPTKTTSDNHAATKVDAGVDQFNAKRLLGKVAVITGGSTGMGLATAKRFVLEGADHVFITGRRKDALESAVAEIGEKATGVPGDVASLRDLDRLYESINEHGRKIDVVFANAGISQIASFDAVDEKFYDLHFDANVKGLFFTVQKALPLLKDGASVILNASIATVKGFPGISVYSATKAAVRSFARTWTNELRERRIRVNAISPGHIDTPIFDSWQQGEALTKMKEGLAKSVPLGRLGDPDEIAKAVAFLASEDASYISGIELFVDGGVAQI